MDYIDYRSNNRMLKNYTYCTHVGDHGMSSISGGRKLSKAALRFQAIGSIEEANSVIGLARLSVATASPVVDSMLEEIQNNLFDIVADLSSVPEKTDIYYEQVGVSMEHTSSLESNISKLSEKLESVHHFVVPFSTNPASTYVHHARSVTRRAERAVVALGSSKGETVSIPVITYLNRLSSFLFVAARYLNNFGKDDVLWKPDRNL